MRPEVLALLEEIGDLGRALGDAIEAGDALVAIATMMQLRRARSALGRYPVAAADDADLARVKVLVLAARGAEAMMDTWLARPVAPDAELLASGLGIATIADKLLPPVWDFDTDLVVLAGEELAPVGELLADLGQRRIVLAGTDRPCLPQLGSSDGGSSCPSLIRADGPVEVAAAIRSLVPVPPAQMMLRGVRPVDDIAEAARAAIADLRIHRNTIRAFSRTWIEQGAANLPAIGAWPSVAALDGAFRGVPMVIAAPGPSLAHNVAQLRALHGRAIVTAFSHSLKAVLAAGVVPDFVITVDPQDVRYHFAGCDLSGTCLVNAATAHPALFELPAPRMLTMSANCAIDDWIFDGLGEEALVPGGGSVATSAFSLALRWGCDPIVFVGLDLSFAPGGAYYVNTSCDGGVRATVDERGSVRVDNWSAGFTAMKASGGPSAPVERAIRLPAWSGDGTVPSSFMFGLFHRWFVERLRSVNDAGVYNCTEGGASIPGMIHTPLAAVARELVQGKAIDVAAQLDRAIAAVDAPARTARLAGRISAFVTALRRCGRLAAAAREMIAAGESGPRL
ncbi:MAG: DUF115 domain-containing protein, partial [Deltaproteobacteria bacterium]|nr:DUF115 domain-containing protein [Deltaproteobacteria bacterium]